MPLLAGKQIDDPSASDSGLHQHEAGMLGGHFADDGGLCASGWDRGQNSASLAGRDNGLPFVGDIQRVETKNLAGSLTSRRHPPGPFRSASRAPKRLRRKASLCGGKLIFDNSWKESSRGNNDLSSEIPPSLGGTRWCHKHEGPRSEIFYGLEREGSWSSLRFPERHCSASPFRANPERNFQMAEAKWPVCQKEAKANVRRPWPFADDAADRPLRPGRLPSTSERTAWERAGAQMGRRGPIPSGVSGCVAPAGQALVGRKGPTPF